MVFLLVFGLILLPVPVSASVTPAKKWGPHVDITGKLGNERSLGDVDLFIPVLQGADSLFFLDLRFQQDDGEAKEGNFGFGYRQMLTDWIFGGYGFYDVRKSEYDNTFHQVTLGVEALSENYDARVNAYMADEDKEEVGGLAGVDKFIYSGNYLLYGSSYEQSMSGFDAEIGGKIPGLAYPQVRAYLGGFHFDAPGSDAVSGPRGRLEVRFPDIFSWDGSLFEVGGEVRHDSVRDTDYFFTARLRIPFGSGTFSQPVSSLTPLEKRMTERVQRDPDIVTTKKGSGKTEPLTFGDEAIEITHVNDDGVGGSGTVEDPYGTLTDAAGSETDIVLLHADSVFDGEGYVMADDQRLLGEADDIDHLVNTDQFGLIVLPRVTEGTEVPVIRNAPGSAVVAGSNAEISGLVIEDSGSSSMRLTGLTGFVDISHVAIYNGVAGLQIGDSAADISLEDVVVDSGSTAIWMYNSAGSLALTDTTLTPGQKGFELSENAVDISMTNSTVFADNNLALDMSRDSGTFYMDETSSITAINDNGAEGMYFSRADGSYIFDGAVTLDGTDTGLSINDSTGGNYDFNNLTIDPARGSALRLSGNDADTTVDIAGPSSITVNSEAKALSVLSDESTLNVAGTVPITAYNGAGLEFNNADGTYSFSGQVVLTGSSSGPEMGIDVVNDSEGSIVFYNAVTIQDVRDDAVYMVNSPGTLAFTDDAPLTIVVDGPGGAGIFADSSGSLIVQGSSNSIDSTGGPALRIASTATDMTFETLTSTGSSGDGIYLYNVAGLGAAGNALTVNVATDITDARDDGIEIGQLGTGSSVTINGPVDVYNSADMGIILEGNRGSITVNGDTTIVDSLDDGLFVGGNVSPVLFNGALDIANTGSQGAYIGTNSDTVTVTGPTTILNSASQGLFISGNTDSVAFSDTLAITDSGSDGMYVSSNIGPVTVEGATTIYNSGGSGLLVAGNQAAVSFNDSLDVNESDIFGIMVTGNTGAVTVEGATTVNNSGIGGVYITGNGYNAITFNDTLDIADSGLDGLNISGNSGQVTVAGATSIYNSGANGLVADGNIGNITLYNSLTVDSSGGHGVLLVENDGEFSAGDTTVINSGLAGIRVDTNYNSATFASIFVGDTGNQGVYISDTTGDFTSQTTTVYNSAAGYAAVEIGETQAGIDLGVVDIQTDKTEATGLLTYNMATLNIDGGTIVTTDATAIDMYNTTVLDGSVVLSSVTSNGADHEGIILDDVDGGDVTIGSVVVTDSGADGIDIVNSDSDVEMTTVNVDTTGDAGLVLENNTGTYNSTTVDVRNTGLAGIVVYNSAVGGDVSIGSIHVDTTGTGTSVTYLGTGVLIDGTKGNFAAGTTEVYNSAGPGIALWDTSGTVAFGTTTVDEAGDLADANEGMNSSIMVVSNYNTVSFGDTTVSDRNGIGIGIFEADATVDFGVTSIGAPAGDATVPDADGIYVTNTTSGGDITYNSLTITSSGGNGINLDGNGDPAVSPVGGTVAGDFDVLHTTTITDAQDNGIAITDMSGDATFGEQTTITNAGTTTGDGVNIAESSGAFTFNDLDVSTVNGSGVVAYNSGSLNIYGDDNVVVANNGNALDFKNTALDVTLFDVTSNDSPDEGIYVEGGTGTVTVTNSAIINNADGIGIGVFDSGVNVDIDQAMVDTTGGQGILLQNNTGSYNSSTVTVTDSALAGVELDSNHGVVGMGDLTITDTGQQGLYIHDTDGDFTSQTTTVYNSAAGYAAVEIGETQAGIDLGVVDIQTDKTEATGLLTYNMATLNIDGGTIVTTDATVIDMYNTTVLDGSVVLSSVTSNGADHEGVIMDDVDGGDVTIGSVVVTNSGADGIDILNSDSDVEMTTVSVDTTGGDGLVLANNTGSYNSSTITVTDSGLAGITVYNTAGGVDLGQVTVTNTGLMGSGTSYGVWISGNDGTVDTDDLLVSGSADAGVFVEGNNAEVTFDGALSVYNSGAIGVRILDNTAAVSVTGVTTIYNSADHGMIARSNDGPVSFYNAVSVTDSGDGSGPAEDGVRIYENEGPVTFYNAVTISGSVDSGLVVYSNYNSVDFGDTLNVSSSGGDGVEIFSNSGDVTVTGATTIDASGLAGLYVFDNAGAVDFDGPLAVSNSAGDGIRLVQNDGPVTVDGATTIYNSADVGLGIRGNTDAITFNGDVTVVDTANNDGIQIANNSGAVDVNGTVSVYNSGLIGIDVHDVTGDVAFDGTNVYNSASTAVLLTNTGAVDLGLVDIETNDLDAAGIAANGVASLKISGGNITTENAPALVLINTEIEAGGVTLYNVTSLDNDYLTVAGIYLDRVTGGDVDITGTATVYNSAGPGIAVLDTTSNVNIGALDIDETLEEGLLIEGSSGDFTVDTTTSISNTGSAGVAIYNSTGTVDLGDVAISNAGAQGIALYNSAAFALLNGTIDNTIGDGVYAENTSLSLDGTQIGVSGAIGGSGVQVVTTDADDVAVALDNLMISNVGGAGISIGGSAGIGTLYVTSLDSNTVTDAVAGGILVDTATFDADLLTAGIQQVVGGDTMIGDLASSTDVSGDGLSLYNVVGSLGFNTLDIGNDGGTGIYIRDADGKAGTFSFATTDGNVNTTNGTAIDIDPVDLDMTLTSVSSSNAAGAGIILDTITGTVDIGTVTVDNSGVAGVSISNSSADIDFGTLDIDTTGAEGVLLANNGGTFTADTTIVANAGTAAISVYNSAAGGSVTFGNDVNAESVNISYSGAEGILLADNAGSVEIVGDTVIEHAADAGVAIYNTVGNEYTGDVMLNDLDISARGGEGLLIDGTAAMISIGDISIDGNDVSAGISISNTGASGSVTIENAEVSNSGAEGIALYDNDGDVTILGGTISAASGAAFLVDGGSSTVVYNGSIVNNSVGYSVEIANLTGGSVSLGGDIIDTGLGVYLHDNSGDINFTGSTLSLTPVVPTTTPLNIVDNSGSVITFDNDTFTLVSSIAMALNATGGGTLNILGPDNEIIAQTGQAVNLSDMELDVTLNTIFSTTSLTGAGVSIYNAGAGSSFVVLGDGSIPSQILGSLGDGIVIEESEGTFVFNDVAITSPTDNGVVLTNNDADITFNDLTVTAAATGVSALNSNVTLNSATLSGLSSDGVWVSVDDGGSYSVAVRDSDISTLGGDGIAVSVYNTGLLNSTLNLLIQDNSIATPGGWWDISLTGDGDVNLGGKPATLISFGYIPEPYSANAGEIFDVLWSENSISSISSSLSGDYYLYNADSLGF